MGFVQTISALNNSGSSITSLAATFGSNNANGNLIVVAAGYFSASAPAMSLADTPGNIFTAVAGPVAFSSCNCQMWYVKQCKGAANTITLSIASSGAPYVFLVATEYTPGANLDQVATSSATQGGGTFTSSSITTLYPNELIVDGLYGQWVSAPTAGSGYTGRYSDGVSYEDQYQNNPGTYSATWTNMTSGDHIANIIASFRILDVTQNELLLCGCG